LLSSFETRSRGLFEKVQGGTQHLRRTAPNFARGDRTPLELFIAAVQRWDAGLRRQLGGGITSPH
jgi:hypothetical protein